MNVLNALLNVQYDPRWEVWAKAPEPDAQARYVQASDSREILERDGWILIATGVQIGDYVRDYCEDIPLEDRHDLAVEAVERYLEELDADA